MAACAAMTKMDVGRRTAVTTSDCSAQNVMAAQAAINACS